VVEMLIISVTLSYAAHCGCMQWFQEMMPFFFPTVMHTDCLWRKNSNWKCSDL